MNKNLIHCNNVKCPMLIEYCTDYDLAGYCSWTCRRIQQVRENIEAEAIIVAGQETIKAIPRPPLQYTRVSPYAKLPALDPTLCTKEFEENENKHNNTKDNL